jgi:hypothetical protein
MVYFPLLLWERLRGTVQPSLKGKLIGIWLVTNGPLTLQNHLWLWGNPLLGCPVDTCTSWSLGNGLKAEATCSRSNLRHLIWTQNDQDPPSPMEALSVGSYLSRKIHAMHCLQWFDLSFDPQWLKSLLLQVPTPKAKTQAQEWGRFSSLQRPGTSFILHRLYLVSCRSHRIGNGSSLISLMGVDIWAHSKGNGMYIISYQYFLPF